MIDLTPLEVRQKKGDFRRAMRGYDADLVDDFLDLVADRMEDLARRNIALAERVEELEAEALTFREKERSLSEALMTAQRLRDDARSLAEKEGELLIREARSAAEAARDEATRMLAREEEALRQVRARRAQLVDSFRRLLERELTELAVIEETLDLTPKAEPGRERAAPRRTPKGGAGTREARPGPEEAETAEGSAAEERPREAQAASPGEAAEPEGREGRAGSGYASEEEIAAGGDAAAEPAPSAGDPEMEGESEMSEDEWLSSLVEEARRDGT